MSKKQQIIYKNILGVDLGGASRNGLALTDNINHKLLTYKTIRRVDSKNNLMHRKKVIEEINNINNEFGIDIILFESVRLFHHGNIQMNSIKSLIKMQTTIINEFSDICPIYAIDVRSWKAKVLGNGNAKKEDSVFLIKHKYPEVNLLDEINHPLKQEIELSINDDLADAICISNSLRFDYDILLTKNKQNYK